MESKIFELSEKATKVKGVDYYQIIYSDGSKGGYITKDVLIRNSYICPNVFISGNVTIEDSKIIGITESFITSKMYQTFISKSYISADKFYIIGQTAITNSELICNDFINIVIDDCDDDSDRMIEIDDTSITAKREISISGNTNIANTHFTSDIVRINKSRLFQFNGYLKVCEIETSNLKTILAVNVLTMFIRKTKGDNLRIEKFAYIVESDLGNFDIKNSSLNNLNSSVGGRLTDVQLNNTSELHTLILLCNNRHYIINCCKVEGIWKYFTDMVYDNIGRTYSDMVELLKDKGNVVQKQFTIFADMLSY